MTPVDRSPWQVLRRVVMPAALAALIGADALAQATAGEAPAAAVAPGPAMSLDALAWLEGCWRGSVNQREFREHWLPLRGGMIIGVGQTVMQDRTQDFEYLRIESRTDGIYYVAVPSGRNEAAFRLANVVNDDRGTEFTFTSEADAFPQRIVYRRGSEGWLYASVEGRQDGEERKVIYPMRRIGCESGEVIRR
jgi:hypothetical protein